MIRLAFLAFVVIAILHTRDWVTANETSTLLAQNLGAEERSISFGFLYPKHQPIVRGLWIAGFGLVTVGTVLFCVGLDLSRKLKHPPNSPSDSPTA